MKNIRNYVLGACILILSGCTSKKTDENILHTSSQPVVINVLDKNLYDDCHIKGSVHADFDKIDTYVQNLRKDTEIIIYCSNYACGTSAFVAKQLQDLGYTKVFVYEGGMAEWYQAGMPVEGPAKASYLSHVMLPSKAMQDDKVSIISMHELAEKLHIESNVAA